MPLLLKSANPFPNLPQTPPLNIPLKIVIFIGDVKVGSDTKVVGCSFSFFSCSLALFSPLQAHITARHMAPQVRRRVLPEELKGSKKGSTKS